MLSRLSLLYRHLPTPIIHLRTLAHSSPSPDFSIMSVTKPYEDILERLPDKFREAKESGELLFFESEVKEVVHGRSNNWLSFKTISDLR